MAVPRPRSCMRAPCAPRQGGTTSAPFAQAPAPAHSNHDSSASAWSDLRDLDGHVATDHRLTAEPGIGGEAGSLIELVLLVLFHLGKVLLSRAHDHVAGGA